MLRMERKTFEEWMELLLARFDHVDKKLDTMNKIKKCFEGDALLDNSDLCQLLGVTKRTVARYRQKKILPYYTYDDGRVYYKSSEVEKFMKRKGGKADENDPV